MKLEGSPLAVSALWIYLIVAIILSVYLNVSWVKMFLLGLIALLGLFVWYFTERQQ